MSLRVALLSVAARVAAVSFSAHAIDLGDDEDYGVSFSGRRTPAVSCGDPPSTSLSVWLDGRSIDGADNATLANNDPITTWTDLGSIGDDPTQASAFSKPTFIASCVNGEACARFDGGDFLRAVTAANFIFMHDGTGATIYTVVKTAASATSALAATSTGSAGSRGVLHRYSTLLRAAYFMADGTTLQVSLTDAVGLLTSGAFDTMTSTLANVATPGAIFVNGAAAASGGTASFSALAPAAALTIGASATGGNMLAGDMVQMLIYAAAHDATERGVVEDWVDCVYGEMPVTP